MHTPAPTLTLFLTQTCTYLTKSVCATYYHQQTDIQTDKWQ